LVQKNNVSFDRTQRDVATMAVGDDVNARCRVVGEEILPTLVKTIGCLHSVGMPVCTGPAIEWRLVAPAPPHRPSQSARLEPIV
jgi:hypothetical protein